MTDSPTPESMSPTLEARLASLVADDGTRDLLVQLVEKGPDPDEAWERLLPMLEADTTIADDHVLLRRACALAGTSRPLSHAIARYPTLLRGEAPASSIPLRLRAALASLAGADVAHEIGMEEATARFSDQIDHIVADAVVSSRQDVKSRHPVAAELPFAVIALGKWGARELNYSSDVDLVFVHGTTGAGETESRAAALALASRVIATLSASTSDGPGMLVDADLRPEGAMGPLSRSLDGYARYYRQWGDAWELQALLKARPAAGDADLGAGFIEMTEAVVWRGELDVDALRSIRRLKEQVEEGARPTDIKRSRGGIRDIEFAVQILQLVHGRLDSGLRARSTLDALDALTESGFIGVDDHERLAAAYRFLRDLEHRIQLWELRQTHDLPESKERRAQLGRSLGMSVDPAAELEERLAQVRSVVRDVHERLYFRPILDAIVGSPSARLGVAEAALRLEALGFKDVTAARRALEDLTAGLSRRSMAMHHLLPLMLDWLSLTPDPDLGLAQLRIVLANTPDHAALVTLLQTNPLAGERLCRLLGTSRLIGELIDRIPEFISRLADERSINEIRDRDEEVTRLLGFLAGRPDPDARIGTIRRFARRRKLRIAARDILAGADTMSTLTALTNSADAAVIAALHVAGDEADTGLGIVAMGKWGGGELSYGSDLDLLYVTADEAGRDRGMRYAAELARIVSGPSRHGEAYILDAELRPEGRRGPLVRSLDSYRRYYEDWSEPWEILALVKARPVAGDQSLRDDFSEMTDRFVWRERLPGDFLRSIREIKARVEKERIPAGEDPDFHLKLGRGGISDVEFLTQLLQLRHGGALPTLRVPGTVQALTVLSEHALLPSAEVSTLIEAYLFCTRVRLRLHLQMGRPVDSLPSDRDQLRSLASSLGFDRSSELREEYRRVTRRARQIFEHRFF